MSSEQAALPDTSLVAESRTTRWWRWRAAVAGFLAISVMVGASEVLAGALPGGRSHVIAVGDEVIDAAPGWLERAVISQLGTSDKPFLITNILVVSGLLGAALGIVAARRFVLGAAGVAFMAGVGTAASLADPQAEGAAPVVVGIASAAAGIATLCSCSAPRLRPEGPRERRCRSRQGRGCIPPRAYRRRTGGGSSFLPAVPPSSPDSAHWAGAC